MKKVFFGLFATGTVLILLGAVVEKSTQVDTVESWSGVVARYYTARSSIPPLPSPVPYEKVWEMMANDDGAFLSTKTWSFNHEGGTLYVAEKSKLSKTLNLPIKILVYEDLMRGEVVVLGAPIDSEAYEGVALFEAPEFMSYDENFPLDQYLMAELSPRRIVWSAVLMSETDAEPASLAVQPMLAGMSAPLSMMMLTVDEMTLGINSSNVTVYVPEGFTNRVELFTTTDLVSNVWNIAEQGLMPTSTNPATWTLPLEDSAQFFRAGNMDIDNDGDGIPDARELIVYKTDPSVSDTDGDEMPDGWEADNGLNPLSAKDQIVDPDHDMLPNVYECYYGLNPNSADSDFVLKLRVDPANAPASNTYASIGAALKASEPYSVIEIAGGVYNERNITFPSHPVMLMSDEWGTNRCVKINSSGFAAFMLSDEQDNRTIIRGLNIHLLGTPLRQFGFYLGRGHTSFTGAAPFFDGVKIQLGAANWSAGFYGLGSTEGTVRFNNCIVRGAGADNTLSGIYLVDAPDVQVVNCSFLEFNASANLSQGILLGTSSQNIGGAASFIDARISNCFWDDSFATNNNYAVVHALGSSGRYQTTVSRSVVPDSSRLLDVDSEISVIEASGIALLDGLILSNSPCRNVSGTDLLSWYDFHGQVRDGTPDIGADEYSAITTNDTDHDGLIDYDEAFVYNTFIFDYDSDGDGVGDGDEVNCGTDPNSRTNYCVTILGRVDDQTGLNASIKANYAINSWGWSSSNALSVSGGTFSYSNQVINSSGGIRVQVLIDLNGNGSADHGEPYYNQPLHITNHTTEIEFTLRDADGDGLSDYDENNCGTDPNASWNYCVTLQGTVTNQTTLPGTMYAAAVLREETRPPSPPQLADEEYESITLEQIEVSANGTFSLDHVVVVPNTNGLSKLWVVVYQDTTTNNVLDYYEPISQILVTPTNHTMTYQLDAPTSSYDFDKDSIPDWWEIVHGLSNSNKLDSFADPDGDWIDNLWEYRINLDPNVYDTNNYAFADAMQAVDARIEGKDPVISTNIYSTQNHSAGIYVRNTNCWAADIDLTSCSPWNSYNSYIRAGTLISPRHALFVNHIWTGNPFIVPAGKNLRFVDATNGVYTAIIDSIHHLNTTNADLTVAVLVEDVPTNRFSFAKVLPDNFTNYIGHADIHIPGLCLDKEEKALVHELNTIRARGTNESYAAYGNCSFQLPVYGSRTNYYDLNEDDPDWDPGVKTGDSGNPAFIILNNEVVLQTLWVYGGGGAGTPIVSFKDEIDAIMSMNGYSLTENGYVQLL